MQGTLNVTTKIVAFADSQTTSQPSMRFVDWTRDISGTPVDDPKSEGHRIEALGQKTLFDGSRTTTLDGTTAFSISLLAVDSASRYRITHTGGTAPGFRTGRALTPSGIALTFTVGANGTLNVASAAPVFGSVVSGDEVFIPHTTTGDAANVISPINAGEWQVLAAVDSQHITLTRFAGEDFSAVSEVVTPTANSQLQAFGAAGVQIGDSVDISDGFNTGTQKTFTVYGVADTFIEIVSTVPLAQESGVIPGASGMAFYTETKKVLYIEVNQEAVVRVNGDTGNTQRVSPMDSSDPRKPGQYYRTGPTWSLVVVNRSTSPLDITVIHAE